MSESCGECGAQTDREPLCEQCNDCCNNDYDSLNAEVERLRAELSQTQHDRQAEHDLRVKLGNENAELHAMLQRGLALMDDQLELEWFRRREKYVAGARTALDAIDCWMHENPKPGAGT